MQNRGYNYQYFDYSEQIEMQNRIGEKLRHFQNSAFYDRNGT